MWGLLAMGVTWSFTLNGTVIIAINKRLCASTPNTELYLKGLGRGIC